MIGKSYCFICSVNSDSLSSINEVFAPFSCVVPKGRPSDTLKPAEWVVPAGRPVDTSNPASRVEPNLHPFEALKPAAWVVPTGHPDETLKPAIRLVPTGRPVDLELLLVWQGLPFLLNLYPQEHSLILTTIEFLHCGHTLYPLGPGFSSISPHSKIRKCIINAIISNNNPFCHTNYI